MESLNTCDLMNALSLGEGLFVLAYAECALWASSDENDKPLDSYLEFKDIAPEALQQMIADCKDFREANVELLASAGDDERNGHDFWLTRNHHGAGFWDRGYPSEIGKGLTDAAHAYGSCDLYVGDNGKVYCA